MKKISFPKKWTTALITLCISAIITITSTLHSTHQSPPAGMALNPDVRQETIAQTICVSGYTKTVRPSTNYTNGVKRKLLREAGKDHTDAEAYELDHFIPLALGGHPRSLDNLALQSWEGTDSAKKKDRLEVKLQCLVCTGEVDLATAQEAIYSDWQAAYRNYIGQRCNRSALPPINKQPVVGDS